MNQDVVDRIIFEKLKELESRRYLERRPMYQKCAWNSFDLDADSGIFWGSPPHLSDIEFRKKYRLSRTTSVDYLGSLKIIQCSKKTPVVV